MTVSRLFRAAAASAVLVLTGFGVVTAGPAPDAAAATRNAAQREADWIVSTQLADGAIPVHPDDLVVRPYDANLAATAIVRHSSAAGVPYHRAVQRWLQWVLARLNRAPDKFGLAGTVYDYTFAAGRTTGVMYWKERSPDDPTLVPATGPADGEPDYDSSDSYAATLLTLVNAYWDAPGSDHAFVVAHRRDWELVAGALTATLDADHLSWAKPWCPAGAGRPRFGCADRAKYLMDNAEVARGLADLVALWPKAFRPAGRWVDAAAAADWRRWSSVATANRTAVLTTLKRAATTSPTSLEFFAAKVRPAPGWPTFPSPRADVWYADSTAQAWPTLFGLLAPTDPVSAAVRRKLNATWAACPRPVGPGCLRDWPTMRNVDAPFAWAEIGYFSALTGPHVGGVATDPLARAQDAFLRRAVIGAGRPGGWGAKQAGWYVRLREQLGDRPAAAGPSVGERR